jgi:transposase
MRDSPCFWQSQALPEPQGLNVAQMAHAWSLAARPVASGLCPERFRPRQGSPRARTRAPCKPQMVQRRDPYPESAAQVCQRWREQGFAGGSAMVTASGRPVRPRRQAACLPLAWAPGAGAQGDWGACGSVPVGQTGRRLRGFVMVLGSSRMRSVACTVAQTLEPFVACHPHAGAFFGGMPPTVRVDNRTSAVRQRALGAAPVCHPHDRALATSPGLTLAPCHGGQGKAKGRVAQGGGYVKKNGLAGLEIPAVRVLHPAARHGLDPVAHSRRHGATRQKPPDLWPQERPPRSPLPAHPVESAPVSQRRASRQGRVTVATHRAAVPAHGAGHALPLTTSPDRLGVDQGETRSARHIRRADRWQDVADPEHPQPRLEQRQKARDQPGCRRFLALSPPAEASDRQREARRRHPPHHGRMASPCAPSPPRRPWGALWQTPGSTRPSPRTLWPTAWRHAPASPPQPVPSLSPGAQTSAPSAANHPIAVGSRPRPSQQPRPERRPHEVRNPQATAPEDATCRGGSASALPAVVLAGRAFWSPGATRRPATGVTRRFPGQPRTRRGGLTACPGHPASHPPGSVPRHENAGAVPLGRADPAQSPPGPAALPPRLASRHSTSHLSRRGRAWQNASRHRLGLYGLPPRLRGALRPCHRCHQHPGGGPACRPSHAGTPNRHPTGVAASGRTRLSAPGQSRR